MSVNRGLFTSASSHWTTPAGLYIELDKEFHFNDDPCPLKPEWDGLQRPWGTASFVNPPYGREIVKWIRKAWREAEYSDKTIVCLIPSRTDTRWWHDWVMKAHEIRFLRGRLKFGDATNSAPFPSAIAIFRRKEVKG